MRLLVEATEEERWPHEPSLPPTTVVSLLIVEVRLSLVARGGVCRLRVVLEDLTALDAQTQSCRSLPPQTVSQPSRERKGHQALVSNP